MKESTLNYFPTYPNSQTSGTPELYLCTNLILVDRIGPGVQNGEQKCYL